MNSYLIDTHILLWWLNDDKNLSKNIKNIISDSKNNIFVSSVTIWEIIIKKTLNKLNVPEDLNKILETSDFDELSMTVEHALYLEKLPLIHTDPFDRLLIAQCLAENLIFITADKNILMYDLKTVSN